jgi:hypothetical protein
VLVFFDNILIFNDSWSSHLQHVRVVLLWLRENNPAVKRIKCVFGTASIAYLGYVILVEGIAMDAEKVAAVKVWPTPCPICVVWGFLGLTGYYHKFIRSYSDIAAPLTQLLKQEAFRWTPEVEAAFNSLKAALTSTLVL